MTKFENPSFGSGANSNAYRNGWVRTFGKPTNAKCEECGGEKLDSSNTALCKKCLAKQLDRIRVDHAEDCTLHEAGGMCSKSCEVWMEGVECFSCGEKKRSPISSNPVCSDCDKL